MIMTIGLTASKIGQRSKCHNQIVCLSLRMQFRTTTVELECGLNGLPWQMFAVESPSSLCYLLQVCTDQASLVDDESQIGDSFKTHIKYCILYQNFSIRNELINNLVEQPNTINVLFSILLHAIYRQLCLCLLYRTVIRSGNIH